MYKRQAINISGDVLASQGFNINFTDQSNPPMEINPAPFNILMPFPEGTNTFYIRKDEKIVDTINISANFPSLTILYPNGGEKFGEKSQLITWSSNDSDGDAMYYRVSYTPDGKVWNVIATNITNTQLIIHPSKLPGGSEAKIRVVATDGVNTSVDESDGSFEVYSKKPEAFIFAPTHNSSSLPKAGLYLHGYAYDLEDGALGESSYSWKSNIDGDLGTGSLVLVNLSPGEHMITLTVKDSDGNKSTATTSIYVGSKLFIPLTLR